LDTGTLVLLEMLLVLGLVLGLAVMELVSLRRDRRRRARAGDRKRG
jgi:hypothetical protein